MIRTILKEHSEWPSINLQAFDQPDNSSLASFRTAIMRSLGIDTILKCTPPRYKYSAAGNFPRAHTPTEYAHAKLPRTGGNSVLCRWQRLQYMFPI